MLANCIQIMDRDRASRFVSYVYLIWIKWNEESRFEANLNLE